LLLQGVRPIHFGAMGGQHVSLKTKKIPKGSLTPYGTIGA